MITVRSLPCSSSTLRSSASAYLVPSWKMCPISMPRADSSPCPHEGQASPSRTSAASMVPSAVKSRPATRSTTCRPGLVGTGHPGRALADPRVEQVADAGRLLAAEHTGPDVALGEHRVGREVLLVEGLHGGRLDLRAEPLLVDLAVAGQADGQRLAGAVGVHEHDEHVLQGVRGRPGPAVRAREGRLEVRDEGVDGRGVGGVLDVRGGHPARVDGIRHRHPHGLDVGRVAAVGAAHVGVLAVLGGGEELLRLRPAHRPGHRLDDHVVEAEPVEDAHVGVAVQLVALVEPGLVDVEGVAVLHHELAPAQHAGARPGLVAVLDLDLVDRQRQVLVRASRGP